MSNGIKNGPGLSVSQIRDLFFPVGVKVISRVSPASLIGGTWELLEEGCTVVAAGDRYEVGSTGGEATHKLTNPEMPSFTIETGSVTTPISINGSNRQVSVSDGGSSADFYWSSITMETPGKDVPHNNMPPYISEYIWTRIA